MMQDIRAKKRIVILGSTGSIGRQALEVVKAQSDFLEVVGLAASTNHQLLVQQTVDFSPQMIVLDDNEAAKKAAFSLENYPVKVLSGCTGISDLIDLPKVDLVVNAMTGFAGLEPTLKALRQGIPVAMANKEPLVAAGELLMAQSRKWKTPILPIDSEPSAIFQCLREETRFLNKIIITASGGPFRGWSKQRLAEVTPKLALNHPNWSMGPKITVDSATLMNKGLEVIEAHWLFNVDYSNIEVVVHPQSLVHSLVEFNDGSILAHLGQPDMRVPIQYALSYPKRWASSWPRLNLAEIGSLTFESPDTENFPSLGLALAAGREGGTMPAVLSGADEEAVALFLKGRIGFLDIPNLVAGAMDSHCRINTPDLEIIREVDYWARCWVRENA
jgi:1-deoxy-D-xylulose-5-phosphate reductoisomerase